MEPSTAGTERKPFYWKLVRNLKRALRAPLSGYRDYQAPLRGGTGIEIGGPTKLFRRDLPVYAVAKSVDGVNFAATTMWEGRLAEGQTYRYLKGRVGRQYVCDATDLARIPPATYDFVLSSNNLEHIANPLKALAEWLRILRPGGHLLLVLPRRESNFDHRREITAFGHLLDDYAAGTTEHDLTHLEEILDRHDYAMTPEAGDRETLERRGRTNFENRGLHHHVFDPGLVEQVLRHCGLEPLLQTTTPTDYVALARKPIEQSTQSASAEPLVDIARRAPQRRAG
ncbi:MAG: class I SAM-dependent methyltransferase [Caldimonas sp.]|nr:class I SAM-dependent methyltransferase [Pseudomonadota bacterium]